MHLWRNPTFRAILYQTILVGLLAYGIFTIAGNAINNLEERGISTGFSFLAEESGFDVSEASTLPDLNDSFINFLVVTLISIVLTVGFVQYLKYNKIPLSSKTSYLVIFWILLLGIPLVGLYFFKGGFEYWSYNKFSSYGLAFIAGIAGTLKVSLLACIISTILGFIVGIMQLSSNWLIRNFGIFYVETLRNIPLLLWLFVFYFSVLRSLPNVRSSLGVGDSLFLNTRGLYYPAQMPTESYFFFIASIILAVILILFWKRYVADVRNSTGRQLPEFLPSIGILIILPLLTVILLGKPFNLDYPSLQGFNFVGGGSVSPEFIALCISLAIYHASFIAEIVRGGIQAVSKGQWEAGLALGLHTNKVMRLIIIPQAMRVIIPPLTSQYLNITKNSSLAVAIGFPELVSIGGTVLNQSGQALEIIALTMLVYMTISLSISAFMNWYNKKMALVER